MTGRPAVVRPLTAEEIEELRSNGRRMLALRSAVVRRRDFVRALDLHGHQDRLSAIVRWWFAGRGPLREALAEAWTGAEFGWGSTSYLFEGAGTASYLWLWQQIALGERIEDALAPRG